MTAHTDINVLVAFAIITVLFPAGISRLHASLLVDFDIVSFTTELGRKVIRGTIWGCSMSRASASRSGRLGKSEGHGFESGSPSFRILVKSNQ